MGNIVYLRMNSCFGPICTLVTSLLGYFIIPYNVCWFLAHLSSCSGWAIVIALTFSWRLWVYKMRHAHWPTLWAHTNFDPDLSLQYRPWSNSAVCAKACVSEHLEYPIQPNYHAYPFKHAVSNSIFFKLQPVYFLMAHVLCTHFNCIKWVPTT